MAVGPQQLLIIILIALLLFGSNRLAEVGKGLGEGIRNFKKGLNGDSDDVPKPVVKPKADSKRLPPASAKRAPDSDDVERPKEENA